MGSFGPLNRNKFNININMSKFLQRILVILTVVMLPMTIFADDYQLPDPSFEDWSGAAFDGNIQPKYWHASNVEQSALGMSFKFNFANREAGHTGNYCIMAKDQVVGAAGITETSPSYYSLGYGWQYLEGLNTGSATAGTKGGYAFTHRPDSISIWIKRTGNNVDKEDFHVLYYAWTETAKGSSYKNKSGSCTSTTVEDEESDIRILLNGNECKTDKAGGQVCEGWWRERKAYGQWTNLRIPIYYINDNTPKKCNLILSASNYPNFRANDGLYEGNSLYVDDVELIYSSKIQTLKVGGKEWKGFDPNSTEVQVFSVPEGTTTVPAIEAYRGAGSLTNPRGTTKDFPGRKLTGSEITITNGTVGGTPTTIVVKAEDGSSTTTYKILFQAAKSSNAKLANIYYTYTNINNEQVRAAVSNFSPSTYNYKVELPYGSKGVPTVEAEKQEDEQTIAYSQPASLADKATITVTAANGTSKQAYNLTFEVGKLADNTLKDIQVNGKSVPGFTPSQAVYKVSLPTSTTTMPTVTPVSAYADGEQTIVHKAPATIDGGTYTLSVTTPGNTVAKVYKLNFKLEASSYSYLKDLKVGDYIKNFDPQNTTYYVNLPLGTTALPSITWTLGDDYQKVAKTDLGAGVVDGTVRVTVTAGNGDQTVYKIVFSTEKSERSTLKGIQIGGVDLEGFDPDVTTYTYALPVGTTTLPEITPIPGDEYQTISVTTAGLNGKTRITVTAGNGTTTIYQIAFSVTTFSDNTLQGIYLDGVLIDGFEAEKEEYWVNLPQGTTVRPTVTYQLVNENLQTASPRDFSGLNGDYKITVRPQSGASRTYIIHFSVATSSNTDLLMIYLNGVEIPGFRSDSLDYIDSLPEGITTIPTVTYKKAEESQRVLSVLEGKTQKITVTAESGAKKEYTVKFIPRASANAFLNMIYLDSVVLPGFKKEVLEYSYPMTGETCPAITVDKAPGQQVTITAPYGAGDAIIKVLPEDGSGNTYTIHFVAKAASSAQLANIAIDGIGIPNFSSDSMNYKATYEKVFPTVTYTKKDASQTVQILWKDSVAWLHVADTLGNKAAYSITFSRIYSGDNTLVAIYANGTMIEGFNPAKLNYSYELNAGSDYPEITYKAKEEAQVVFFGKDSVGHWSIAVAAENGNIVTYTVAYTIKPYTDITLKDLKVEGYPFTYIKSLLTYGPFSIPEGVELPKVTAVPEDGQSVMIFNENDSVQRIMVMAENGQTNTYSVIYTRVKSSEVHLANIFIDGKALVGFNPDTLNYTVTLPRDAKVVPNVNPIAKLSNQTVTTYFSKPNGVTVIEVKAQDGTTGKYTIAFPLEKSDNTLLKSLMIDGETKDVNVTEYSFNVPFGTINPYDVAYELDEGQLVHYVDAPLSGVTKIIVTNEKGNNSRTYSISYTVGVPQGVNKVKSVKYSYINVAAQTVNGELEPVKGDNVINLPFGAKSFNITEVEKNFPEQTIQLFDGGIRRGAKIIAVANRSGEDDVEYTITPVMPEFATEGKLQSLKYYTNGEWIDVPRFRPDVYNYMINVKNQPKANSIQAVAYGGKTVTHSDINAQKKQITFTVEGGETYSICWFYDGDEWPFTYERVQSKIAHWYEVSTLGGIFGSVAKDKGAASAPTGYKPKGWHVPADLLAYIDYDATVSHFTYYTGHEVTVNGEKELTLSTLRGGALNSSMPGTMTLGGMSLPDGVKLNGKTKVSFEKNLTNAVQYRNTPEQFAFDYQPIMTTRINTWNAWVCLGTASGASLVSKDISGSYSNLGKWQTSTTALSYTGTVGKLNIMLCASEASGSSYNIYNGPESYAADLQIRNMRMVFNSALTGAKVNGEDAELSDKTFTITVSDDFIGIPSLKFAGKVQDQTQTIEWLNNGEWINGQLTAKVVNYGENANVEGRDSTIYNVILQRTPVTSVDHTADFGSYATTVKDDTVFVNLPYGTKFIPDLTITPASIHQLVSMTKKGNAVTVNVKAEDGAEKTTVYVFREIKENDVEFESALTASDKKGNNVPLNTVDAEHFIYSVEVEEMPTIEYTKKDGQKVDINYTLDGAVLIVTAADGVTTRTYTVNRVDPIVTTSAQIDEFSLGGNPWDKLGKDDYEETLAKPEELITFEREFKQDSVVYIQTPDSMEWKVFGSENHRYVLRYPTEPSDNVDLANILIDGVPYSQFSVLDDEYTIEVDSMITLTAVESEPEQSVVTTQTTEAGEIVVYTSVVTAENGDKRTYKMTVRRPRSDNAFLAGILLDSVLVENFDPATLTYTVVLPTPAVKVTQPQMPSLTYVVGQTGQKVELTPGELNGNDTEIIVTSEDGVNKNTYFVSIQAQPSACVDLTGITVNGVAVDQFEPGRHFYSQSLATNNIEIDYLSDDRFQTVTILKETIREDHEYRFTLNVKAENGDEANYEVTIYVENQSNDAKLANITLDGKNFEDFERALNLDLTFDPGNNNYEINLPSGTTIVPEVSAQLKMDGQQVEIIHKVNPITNFTDSILLEVTAVDGVEKNTYVLKFLVPLSTNADLSMIFLDGDSLKNFDPTYYFYQVELPVGVHTMPEVAAQKGEAGQTIKSIEIDQDKLQATIKVLAEDKTVRENTYVVVFHLTQSEEDKLDMIYEDGQPLSGFDENTMYYTLSLPVGTSNFPDLGWLEKDDYQTIAIDTVEATLNTLIRQIIVTSESGKKNTYTVSYTIEKSDVDTLQMLFIDHKPLANFEGKTVVYLDTLSAAYAAELAGQLPIVEYTVGDEYQTVLVSQVPEDELSEKSLGYKSIITVTAATGKTRIYTIHYPVELSNDATLNMINVSAKPLANYDAERFNYRLEIAKEASVPVVTVIKKEEAQTYEIRALGDTVQIVVWAESKKDSATYTLTFERLKSANTMLRDIILTDINTGERLPSSEFPYRPEVYSYIVNVPYDSKKELISLIPSIEPEFYEEEQTADTTVHYLPDGDIQIDITVTAANEEDQAIYSIIFHFVKPADATLASLTIKGEEFIDFRPTKTEYVYAHPYGTDPADYFTIDEVKYVLSDSLAVDTMYMDESGVINIVVVAQDGRTSMTYLISQITAEDGDNALAWITIDGDTIPGFDPEVLFYTYYVFESDMPSLNAEPRSENADVDKGRVTAGDTTTIICTAADGSERYYYVYFAITTVNPGDVATSGDVLIKRVPGAMQLAAYTVRQGVSIALYDQYGHLLYNERVPVANPNDTEIVEDSDQKEFLNDVDGFNSGLIIDVLPGQPYFYCFYYDGKKKLASGKIMCY